MSDFSAKLSAYLDGELSDAEAKSVEDAVTSDPKLEAELAALLEANDLAKQYFEEQLHDPVPLHLAKSIKEAGNEPVLPTASSSIWQSVAAGLVLFALGGAGGYLLHQQTAPSRVEVASAGWLTQIADYHAVYAKQKRHLVEVPADQITHIEKWLGKTVGFDFSVPDLSDQNLSFEGARLLVVKGAPVAQLMYKQPGGGVVALCFKRRVREGAGSTETASVFKTDRIKTFDFVSWKDERGDFTVVGPKDTEALKEVAKLAATRV